MWRVKKRFKSKPEEGKQSQSQAVISPKHEAILQAKIFSEKKSTRNEEEQDEAEKKAQVRKQNSFYPRNSQNAHLTMI